MYVLVIRFSYKKKSTTKKLVIKAVNGPLFQFVPHYVWRYGTHGGGAKTKW